MGLISTERVLGWWDDGHGGLEWEGEEYFACEVCGADDRHLDPGCPSCAEVLAERAKAAKTTADAQQSPPSSENDVQF